MPPPSQQPTAVGVRRRACVNCTAGKAKCSPFSSSECERCHRLGKECTYLNVMGKRKSPGSNLRMQTLEKKVDGLVHLLAGQQQNEASLGGITQAGTKPTAQNTPDFPYPYGPLGPATISTGSSPQQSDKSDFTGVETSDIIDRSVITLQTAQELFDRYLLKAIYYFPFVVLPPDASLSSLRCKTPFLFLCIMTSMMIDNCPLQRQLGEELRLQIHRRILVDNEKSLELLQGILVHLSWYHYIFHPQKQQVTLLTQLCVTLVQELGLDRNPKNTSRRTHLAFEGRVHESPYSANPTQLRALLGTYYMASSFATKFRKRSTMPYTKYMQQACELLTRLNEYPTDELLIYLVRNTELSRRVHDTFSLDDLENGDIRGEVITNVMVQSFMHELESLRNSVPGALKDDITLNLDFISLASLISEVALHETFWEPDRCISQSSTQNAPIPSSTRCNMLWTSIQNCKVFMDRLIRFSNQDSFYITNYTFTKVCYVIIWLANLAEFKMHASTREHSRDHSVAMRGISIMLDSVLTDKEGELPDLTRQLLLKLKSMAAQIKTREGEPDAMTIFSLMLHPVISGYDKRMRDTQKATIGQSTESSGISTTTTMEENIEYPPLSSYIQPTDDINFYGTMTDLFTQNPDLQPNAFEDMVWDKMMNDFVLPL